MPLARISLRRGKPAEYRRRVAQAVQRALVETFDVPPDDRFQIITEHDADSLIYDSRYLGVERSDGLVVVELTVSFGRTLDQKRALFRHIAQNLAEAVGLRPEDALIVLVETARVNWSFGHGLASYAPVEAATA
jgi:phenylpyruvate tautomerase PptA (4-oxalocrotonate tautomerase family)